MQGRYCRIGEGASLVATNSDECQSLIASSR